jgi:hypothetical protein
MSHGIVGEAILHLAFGNYQADHEGTQPTGAGVSHRPEDAEMAQHYQSQFIGCMMSCPSSTPDMQAGIILLLKIRAKMKLTALTWRSRE